MSSADNVLPLLVALPLMLWLWLTAVAAWSDIADHIPILFDEALNIHPEFARYQGDRIKQADVVLLAFPLGVETPKSVRKAELEYYEERTDAGLSCCVSLRCDVMLMGRRARDDVVDARGGSHRVGRVAQSSGHVRSIIRQRKAPVQSGSCRCLVSRSDSVLLSVERDSGWG